MAAAKPSAPAPAEAKKGGSMMMMIVVLLLGLGLGGGGAWFVAGKAAAKATPAAAAEDEAGDDEEAEAEEEAGDDHGGGSGGGKAKAGAIYVSLAPALVVNIEDMDAVRYLQVEVDVLARKPAVEDAVKLHMPAIRNALLMLMSQQDYRALLQVTGKEKLRQDALAEVRRVLKEQAGMGGVENLYFTSFVSQ